MESANRQELANELDAFLEVQHRAAVGPDQAWRDFTEVSTIYREDKDKHTEQSRLESLLEATINMASGFGISWLVWMFIAAPLFDIEAPVGEAFALTCLFTITSMARSYAWRRFFATDVHRRIHQWLRP
jgi:hypothetical protein